MTTLQACWEFRPLLLQSWFHFRVFLRWLAIRWVVFFFAGWLGISLASSGVSDFAWLASISGFVALVFSVAHYENDLCETANAMTDEKLESLLSPEGK